MSMLKLIQAGSQRFDEPIAQLIKISSRGRLIGHDRFIFEKRAGASIMQELDKVAFMPGEIPIHLLAIGATEDYGPNRNGDGFCRRTCRERHHTFVKHARFYRDHLNKDPSKSYGIVKLSAWHDPMKRIELVCGLNGTEEAAARNGGLVADKEREKLANDEEIPVSMACRVAFDVCAGCGNKARTRKEYCTGIDEGGLCKRGGVRNRMGVLHADGFINHVENPDATFTDISDVFRGADRIAFITGQLEKAAAYGAVPSGAELAEALGLTVPWRLLVSSDMPRNVADQIKLAAQLADLEREAVLRPAQSLAFAGAVQPPVLLPPDGQDKFSQVLRALVDNQSLLPVRDFIRLTTGTDVKQASDAAELVQAQLPGIYGRLYDSGELETLVQTNPYVPATVASEAIRSWAHKQAADLSLAEPWFSRRLHRAVLRNVDTPVLDQAFAVKLAAAGGPAAKLAEHYALYKLAFLSSVSQTPNDLTLTATAILMQNYAC